MARDLSDPVIRMLTQTRGTAGGDLDKVLIMLVVMLRTDPKEASNGRGIGQPDIPRPVSAGGTNIRSIADSTGIPRLRTH